MEVMMPYWRLYYHLVWATKDRQPLIYPEYEDKLYSVIRIKASSLGGQVSEVNAAQDHIHIATTIPPSIAIGRFIGEIKGASSHHVNHCLGDRYSLYWQDGYGVVSFRHDNLAQVMEYIRRQKQHHAAGSIWPSLETWDEKGEELYVIKEDIVEYDPFTTFVPEAEASG